MVDTRYDQRGACHLAIRCWGNNELGQLGYGNKTTLGDDPGELPTPAVQLGEPALSVEVGDVHTCAVLTDGRVKCWGHNAYGGLGIGTTEDLGDQAGEMPPPDAALGGPAVALTAHDAQFTCALLSAGTVRCWGYNFSGGLGLGHTMNVGDGELPLDVPTVLF